MRNEKNGSGKWSYENNGIKLSAVIDSDGDDDVEMLAQILFAYTTNFANESFVPNW